MFCLGNTIDKQSTDVLQIKNSPCAQSRLSVSPLNLQLSLSEGFNLEPQWPRLPALCDIPPTIPVSAYSGAAGVPLALFPLYS